MASNTIRRHPATVSAAAMASDRGWHDEPARHGGRARCCPAWRGGPARHGGRARLAPAGRNDRAAHGTVAHHRDALGGPRPAMRDHVVDGAAVRGPGHSATGHRAQTAIGGHQEGT